MIIYFAFKEQGDLSAPNQTIFKARRKQKSYPNSGQKRDLS